MTTTTAPHMWKTAPAVFPRHAYVARARAVYWHNAPACRAKGRCHAECLLTPDHPGDHYGNGYDDLGPLAPARWPGDGTDPQQQLPV